MFSSNPTTQNKSKSAQRERASVTQKEVPVFVSLLMPPSLFPVLYSMLFTTPHPRRRTFPAETHFVCIFPSSIHFRGSPQPYSFLSIPFYWLRSPEVWSNPQLLDLTHSLAVTSDFTPLPTFLSDSLPLWPGCP